MATKMKRSVDWFREITRSVVVRLIAFSILAVLAFFSHRFKQRFTMYNSSVLLLYGLVLIVSLIWDVAAFRKLKRIYVPLGGYFISIALFLSLSIWSDTSTVEANTPIWASLIVFGAYKLSHLSAMQQWSENDRNRVGFSVTGLVVCDSDPDDPAFVLVLNRNLRKGNGLWVPPGGHFRPYEDDPLEKLLMKVRQEIGVQCSVPEDGRVPRQLGELRTNDVRWFTAPAFLLEENLMGRCSYGHEIHFDLIYLLRTDGAIVNGRHKYSTEQINVPVRRCAESLNDTERAISAAIEGWHLKMTGARPSVRDSLTSDVIWRLHLAAKMYIQSK